MTKDMQEKLTHAKNVVTWRCKSTPEDRAAAMDFAKHEQIWNEDVEVRREARAIIRAGGGA